MNNKIVKNAVVNAGGTVVYIVLVASFFFGAQNNFGQGGGKDTILIPIGMLLLLVLSAAITSSLVFGRPVLWYLEGQKKEALSLLAYTLGFLFVVTILVLAIVYAVSS